MSRYHYVIDRPVTASDDVEPMTINLPGRKLMIKATHFHRATGQGCTDCVLRIDADGTELALVLGIDGDFWKVTRCTDLAAALNWISLQDLYDWACDTAEKLSPSSDRRPYLGDLTGQEVCEHLFADAGEDSLMHSREGYEPTMESLSKELERLFGLAWSDYDLGDSFARTLVYLYNVVNLTPYKVYLNNSDAYIGVARTAKEAAQFARKHAAEVYNAPEISFLDDDGHFWDFGEVQPDSGEVIHIWETRKLVAEGVVPHGTPLGKICFDVDDFDTVGDQDFIEDRDEWAHEAHFDFCHSCGTALRIDDEYYSDEEVIAMPEGKDHGLFICCEGELCDAVASSREDDDSGYKFTKEERLAHYKLQRDENVLAYKRGLVPPNMVRYTLHLKDKDQCNAK